MTKIITCAQLALLPKGTRVSPIKMNDDGSMVFDIQGWLHLGPKSIVRKIDAGFIHLVGELPDVYVDEGRVVTHPDERSISRHGDFPHRFVLWECA